MKTPISTPQAPAPIGAYSQATLAGGFVFTSGFGPSDPKTGEVPEGVVEQTRAVLRSIEVVLGEHGLDLTDVVKATVHLQELKRDFADFNRTYAQIVPTPFPSRTTVGSDLMDILVEIDVVAALR
jgi:2-iminobutanoate/2-iminopropanoate deaminase